MTGASGPVFAGEPIAEIRTSYGCIDRAIGFWFPRVRLDESEARFSRAVRCCRLDLATAHACAFLSLPPGHASNAIWTESSTAHTSMDTSRFWFSRRTQRFEARRDAPARDILFGRQGGSRRRMARELGPSSPRILPSANFPDPRVLRSADSYRAISRSWTTRRIPGTGCGTRSPVNRSAGLAQRGV